MLIMPKTCPRNHKITKLKNILFPPRTVPVIVFKMDILAQKVNFMKLKKQAFFNILDTLFEAQYSENLKLLIISA